MSSAMEETDTQSIIPQLSTGVDRHKSASDDAASFIL